jgi:predicted phage gp36 major capsid-like protein
MVAGVLASLAELELELGRERRMAAREARRARGQHIGRPKALDEKKTSLAQDDLEFDEASAEFNDLDRHVQRLDRAAVIARAAGEGSATLRIERPIDPYAGRDAAQERAYDGQRDSAMRQLDRSVKAGLPARSAEVVEHLGGTGNHLERSWVNRWVTDTGTPEYRSAFAKILVHGESRASLEWTGPERAAYDRVARLKDEQRAMSLTDSAGGFLVPFELDPVINLVSAGSTNPLLQIADVKTVHTDVWHGVSSAGVVAEWLAEAAEASDASPTLAEPTIPNYKASTFVPFSFEVEGDATAILSQVQTLMNDGLTQLLNVAFTTGSGTGKPDRADHRPDRGKLGCQHGQLGHPCGSRHLRCAVVAGAAFPSQRPLGGQPRHPQPAAASLNHQRCSQVPVAAGLHAHPVGSSGARAVQHGQHHRVGQAHCRVRRLQPVRDHSARRVVG